MAKATTCPICDRPMPGDASEWPDRPFCSPRCRQIDLGRWLGERYGFGRLPEGDEDEEDQSSA